VQAGERWGKSRSGDGGWGLGRRGEEAGVVMGDGGRGGGSARDEIQQWQL